MKDIYLKFTKKANSKDIPGESLNSDHKNWLEIESWSQAIKHPTSTTVSTAGGHSSGRCEHAPMTFLKNVDKASVYMYEACSAGYSYDVEIIFYRSSGTVRTSYMTIKLFDAIIDGISSSVSPGSFPMESFTVKYSKITWEHKSSKADGSANVGRDSGGWDLAQNKATA